MRRLNQTLWNYLLFVSGPLAASVLYASSALAEKPFRLGVFVPLSGEAAGIGTACRNGTQLAMEELDASLKTRLEIRYEDDQNDPLRAVTAYRALQGSGLDAVLSFTSGPSKALAPLTEAARIPLIAIASAPEIVEGRAYASNLWVSPKQEALTLRKELERRKWLRIARISAIQAGMLAMKEAFDRAPSKSVAIVVDDEFPTEAKDFRTFLAKLALRKDLDAIFVNLYVGQTGIFARQAREMGIKLPLINIETFENPDDVAASQGALLEQLYIQADEANAQFSEEYARRFPGATPFTAGNCYDAVRLIAQSLRLEIPPHEHLRTVTSYSGAMGSYSAVGDGTFTLPAALKRVTRSGFEKVEGKE